MFEGKVKKENFVIGLSILLLFLSLRVMVSYSETNLGIDALKYPSSAMHSFRTYAGFFDVYFPPFYPFLIKITNFVFNNFYISGLAVNIVISLATLLIAYLTIKELYGKETALWSSFFLSILAMDIDMSRQTLVEPLFLFLFSLSLYLLIKKRYLFAGIAGAMLVLTKELWPMVILPGFVIVFLLEGKFTQQIKAKWKYFFIYLIPILMAFFLWTFFKYILFTSSPFYPIVDGLLVDTSRITIKTVIFPSSFPEISELLSFTPLWLLLSNISLFTKSFSLYELFHRTVIYHYIILAFAIFALYLFFRNFKRVDLFILSILISVFGIASFAPYYRYSFAASVAIAFIYSKLPERFSLNSRYIIPIAVAIIVGHVIMNSYFLPTNATYTLYNETVNKVHSLPPGLIATEFGGGMSVVLSYKTDMPVVSVIGNFNESLLAQSFDIKYFIITKCGRFIPEQKKNELISKYKLVANFTEPNSFSACREECNDPICKLIGFGKPISEGEEIYILDTGIY